MTTVELEKQLDLDFLGINESQFTEEEIEVIQSIGRVARNLEFLDNLPE